MVPGHSGVSGTWGPEYKLRDLNLLKPDKQGLSVKRGLIQKVLLLSAQKWVCNQRLLHSKGNYQREKRIQLQINWKLLLWLPAGQGLMSVWFRSMTRCWGYRGEQDFVLTEATYWRDRQ
ncbi:uncharacterized protein LOC144314396 [Canis aureus]